MDWLPLRVLKPKMTAAEFSRYLLGACGKIIAQGNRSEKCICATDVICCC